MAIGAVGSSAAAESKVEGAETSVGESEARGMDCGITQRHEGGAEGVDGGMTGIEGTGPDQQELVKNGERIGRSTQDG